MQLALQRGSDSSSAKLVGVLVHSYLVLADMIELVITVTVLGTIDTHTLSAFRVACEAKKEWLHMHLRNIINCAKTLQQSK